MSTSVVERHAGSRLGIHAFWSEHERLRLGYSTKTGAEPLPVWWVDSPASRR